jgi:eukaryotic-like serine/threonine-protein kinase
MPKVLGRYHIISELGRGGMGVVYKAVDPKLERFIAIKCLSEELSEDEITVTRFLREARNVAALNHPHIAQIFLADEDEGKPYFVMEYIDGESLAERLARDGRLMPEQALRIVSECGEALKAAHEENIVHRDIKPGNIMIDRRGRCVLTDFGIASIVHPENQPATSKYIMGTPGYLPPEVMTGKPADHRGDIFALGAVYYEMLAGKRLVPGRDIEDTARTLLAADFPQLSDLGDKLDEVAFGVLGKMVARDPDKRYQDYETLLEALRMETGKSAQASVSPPPPAAPATGDEPTVLADPPSSPSAASTDAAEGAEPPATEAMDPAGTEPPATQTAPPPAGRSRLVGFGIAGALVLSLVLVGHGLARMAPDQWDQVTSLVSLDRWTSSEIAATEEDAESASEQFRTRARETREEPADDDSLLALADEHEEVDLIGDSVADIGAPEAMDPIESAGESETHDDESLSAGAARLADASDSEPSDPAGTTEVPEPSRDAEPSREVSDLARAEPESPMTEQPEAVTEQGLQMATVPAPAEETTPREAAPQPQPEPTPAAPEGVLVVGIGDPVFVDPMVREVEEDLRRSGHEIVERGFVSGLSRLIDGSEVDLAGLSEAATRAGAGYAVVVRAMPAGQRELRYYGRHDTSFMVQTEAVTYDLNNRRRLGASQMDQVEYTALNATRQARDTIAPRLAAIRDHLAD